MTNMRAYKDGKRLVIVLEDAGQTMEDYVVSLLSGTLMPVEHLGPPPPMDRRKVDTGSMSELKPAKEGKTEPPKAATAGGGNGAAAAAPKDSTAGAGVMGNTNTMNASAVPAAVSNDTVSGSTQKQAPLRQGTQSDNEPVIPKKQLPKFIQNAQKNVSDERSDFKPAESRGAAAPVKQGKRPENAEKREAGSKSHGIMAPDDAMRIPVEDPGKKYGEKIVTGQTSDHRQEKAAAAAAEPAVPQSSASRSTRAAGSKAMNPGIHDVATMDIFRLKAFLLEKRSDEKLRSLLLNMQHTADLEFVLRVKSERELRSIALQLVS